MKSEYNISREATDTSKDKTLRIIYGHIVDILRMEDQSFYIAYVVPEQTSFAIEMQGHYIPIDETPESLAANYGAPEDLIGLRVRVEYYGLRWRSGVARIVPSRSRESSGNITELPSRGFRYAVAGEGSN